MALVACYDPQGNVKMKEPVDARECVEHCGYTMTPPESAPKEALQEATESTAKAEEENQEPKPKTGKGRK